ncbi:hypothetical protein [Bathymodiolus platifrons methanotrophic gill symbiont]|uniref:hypothetical protein n=1 Tax=Bathymodiolus platifrons methanotrophic gill symbiont TaxID=113268 RepID=UPI001C8EE66A|nr:hypothetical protein [Bathymodiolus platifrons methanotrophic gill symbiont]
MLLAHVESANCPVAYQGLKITTSLSSVSMIFSGGRYKKQNKPTEPRSLVAA